MTVFRLRALGACAAALLVLGGCASSSSALRFEEPVGASFRIDEGAARAVPFALSLSPGIHGMEILAPAAGSARGYLVVLEPVDPTSPAVRIPAGDLLHALDDGAVIWSATDGAGREALYAKFSAEGVPVDDSDLVDSVTRSEDRRKAEASAAQARKDAARTAAEVRREEDLVVAPTTPPKKEKEVSLPVQILGAIVYLFLFVLVSALGAAAG